MTTGAIAGGTTGAAASVVVTCAVVEVEVEVEVDVDDDDDEELDDDDDDEDEDVGVDVVLIFVDVASPPPLLTFFALGIAVHLFPDRVVIKAPDGRLPLVAMAPVLQFEGDSSRRCVQSIV